MNMNLIFSTPVWIEDMEKIDIIPIEKLCRRLRSIDLLGRKLSNQGGWQSQDFLAGTYDELQLLENRIIDQANQCVRDYGYIEEKVAVVIGNMWANINDKGHSNSVHIHDDSFISGVFYVKAKPGQGNINFYKDYNTDYIIASQAPIKYYNHLNSGAMSYEPLTGRLILFPGHLPHGVENNELDEDRISISFNVRILKTDDRIHWSKDNK